MKSKQLGAILGGAASIAAVIGVVIAAWPYIFPSKVPLQAQILGPSESTTEQNNDFSASASGGVPPYSYKWHFYNGQSGEGQNVTRRFVSAQTYTTSLTVTDNVGNSVSTAISTVVRSLSPTLTIQGFSALQGINPFGIPRFFNDHHPPCGGATQPACDYGQITGSVLNTGPGQATSCHLQIHQTVHIDDSVLLPNNAPRNQSSDIKQEFTPSTIAVGETRNFAVNLDFQNPGDYKFTGQIFCTNGLSQTDEKSLHVRLE